MAMLGTATARVTLDASGFVAGAAKVASASSQMENAVSKGGKGLGDKILANSASLNRLGLGVGAAGAGITAFFIGAQKTANAFGKEMANVNSIAQVDTKTLGGMSDQVERLAVSTGRGPADLAAGLYDVYSVGFKGADAMNILNLSAKGANAGLSDTSTTVKVLTGTLNAFGEDGSQAQKYMDVLFQTVNDGAVSFDELSHNLANTAPLASTMGVSVQELGASYALMTANGIPAAQTETQIASLMRSGINPTTDMSKALTDYGYTSVQSLIKAKGFGGYLEFLNKASGGTAEGLYNLLGSSESVNAALVLGKGDLKGYNKELQNMKHASDGAGATQKALDKQMESTSFKLQRLGAVWDVVQIKMANTFNKPLNMGIDGITKLLDMFLQLPPGIQKAIATIAGFTGFTLAAGGAGILAAVKIAEFGKAIRDLTGAESAISGIGKLVTGPFTKLGSAMKLISVGEEGIAAGPLLPWVVGIAAAAGLAYLAYKTNFLGIGDMMRSVGTKAKDFWNGFTSGFKDAHKNMNLFSAGMMGLARGITTAFGGKDHMVTGFAKTLVDSLYNGAQFVQKFGNYLGKAFSFGTQFQNLAKFGPIARGFVGSVGIVAASLGKLAQAYHKGGLTGLAKEIPNTVGHIGDAFQSLSTGIARSLQALGNKFKPLKNITDPLSKAFYDAGIAGQHMFHAIGDLMHGDLKGALKDVTAAGKRFGMELQDLGKAGGAALEDVGNLIQKGVGGAMNYLSNRFPAFNGLWDHLNGVLGGVGGVVKNVGQALGDLARGDFGGMFKNLGQAGLDGLKALGNAMGTVPALIAGTFKSIPWDKVGSALQTGLGKASDLAFRGLNAAGGAIAKGWDGMVDALKNFSWSGLGNALQNGLQSASNMAFSALNAAGGALAGAWDWIKNAASKVDWSGIADTLTGGLAGAVAGLAGAAAGAAGDLWGWIKDKISDVDWIGVGITLGLKIFDAARGLVHWVEAGATSLWNWLKDLGSKIKDHLPKNPGSILTDFGKGIVDGLKSGFETAWGAFASFVEGKINDLIGLINKAIDAFNKLPGPDIDFVPYIGALGKIQSGIQGAAKQATGGAIALSAFGAAAKLAGEAAGSAFDKVFPPVAAKAKEPAPATSTINRSDQGPAQPVVQPPTTTNIGGFINAQIIKMASDYAAKVQSVQTAMSGLVPSISKADQQNTALNQSMLHTIDSSTNMTWQMLAMNQGMASARIATAQVGQGLSTIGQAATQGTAAINPLAQSISNTNQQTALMDQSMLHTIDSSTNMTWQMLAMNAAMGIARHTTADVAGIIGAAISPTQQFAAGVSLLGLAAGASFAGIAVAATTGLMPLPGILLGAALASTAVAIPAFASLATESALSFATIPTAASVSLGGMVGIVSGTTASAAASAIANTGQMAGGAIANAAEMAGGVIGSSVDMAGQAAASAASMASQVGSSAANMASSATDQASSMHSNVTGEMIGMAADVAIQTAIAAASAEASSSRMGDAGRQGGTSYAFGIEMGMSLAQAAAAAGAAAVAGALSGQDLSGAGFSTGASFSAGVASGILSNLGAVQAAASQIVSAAAAASAATALIHSPSKLFWREIGEPITLGVAGGMTSMKSLTAVRRAGSQLVGAARGTLGVSRLPVAFSRAGGSGGSAVVNNNNQQINVYPPQGADNEAIARQVVSIMMTGQGSAA